MSFQNLGLRPELLDAITSLGYATPTPIQLQAIPAILNRRDVLGGAQTGTGKTAAFGLPLVHLLSSSRQSGDSRPRGLILTPTRELAAQIEQCLKEFSAGLSLYSTAIYGGTPMNPQIKKLRKGVDIIVATPGRLLDHVRQKTLCLSQIEIVVLDEADRMLDMGFINDMKKIIALVPAKRQTLLFSATYTDQIKSLASTILRKPVFIEVSKEKHVEGLIEHIVHPAEKTQKRALLSHLIRTKKWSQVLIFTNTKHGANNLARQLKSDGIRTLAIHGNKSQSARTSALAEFKNGSIRALVATEVAARGLDIDGLPHVVNYDLPLAAQDYVHRIGRTGRAGNQGIAVSIVSSAETRQLKAIESLLQRKITQQLIQDYAIEKNIPSKTRYSA